MKLKTLALGAAMLTATFAFTAPAAAQEATKWPEAMMAAADADKDGMVTKQEFMDHMGKMWDRKHAAMMKSDTAMKAGMMDKKQFTTMVRALFVDPGQIGG